MWYEVMQNTVGALSLNQLQQSVPDSYSGWNDAKDTKLVILFFAQGNSHNE